MAKRKAEQVPQKKVCLTFKHEWLDEIVQTDTGRIKLSDIFTYEERSGVICKFCSEAKAKGEFARGKTWSEWKLDYLKQGYSIGGLRSGSGPRRNQIWTEAKINILI